MSRIDEIDRNHTKEEMYEMGMEFRYGGCTVVQMPETAIKYFKKAAERGHIQAQYELIEWYNAAALQKE